MDGFVIDQSYTKLIDREYIYMYVICPQLSTSLGPPLDIPTGPPTSSFHLLAGLLVKTNGAGSEYIYVRRRRSVGL